MALTQPNNVMSSLSVSFSRLSFAISMVQALCSQPSTQIQPFPFFFQEYNNYFIKNTVASIKILAILVVKRHDTSLCRLDLRSVLLKISNPSLFQWLHMCPSLTLFIQACVLRGSMHVYTFHIGNQTFRFSPNVIKQAGLIMQGHMVQLKEIIVAFAYNLQPNSSTSDVRLYDIFHGW